VDYEPSLDPEGFGEGEVDCEPSVDPEESGKGGVEVESEYDLELRIGGNLGRPSLLTVPNKAVRW
jgi:hypothetical protein